MVDPRHFDRSAKQSSTYGTAVVREKSLMRKGLLLSFTFVQIEQLQMKLKNTVSRPIPD